MQNYTKEQVEEVKEREKKALAMLKELELTPAAQTFSVNIGKEGEDVFAIRIVPYLQDTKYQPKPSPYKEEKK